MCLSFRFSSEMMLLVLLLINELNDTSDTCSFYIYMSYGFTFENNILIVISLMIYKSPIQIRPWSSIPCCWFYIKFQVPHHPCTQDIKNTHTHKHTSLYKSNIPYIFFYVCFCKMCVCVCSTHRHLDILPGIGHLRYETVLDMKLQGLNEVPTFVREQYSVLYVHDLSFMLNTNFSSG